MTRANGSGSNVSEGAEPRLAGFTRFAQRRPITAFALGAFAIGWPVLAVPAITGIAAEPFLLLLTWIGLLGSALVVTRITGGSGALRRLLSRALIWRFGPGRWLVIILAMPVLTVALAAASGTLDSPDGGWASVAFAYLLQTLLLGALINLWEETAWGGFAQTRLMERHGLLVGSLVTAPLFAGIHLPLLFESGWTWSDVGTGLAVLVVAAPFYRYLLGLHLLATGGSILAIGIQHASWNAAGDLDGVHGDWQSIVAAILLTGLVAAAQRPRWASGLVIPARGDRSGRRPRGEGQSRRGAVKRTAAVALVVLAVASCSSAGSDDLAQASRTANLLDQQGFEVGSMESQPNDNLAVRIGIPDGGQADEAGTTAARIVWQHHPVRIESLDVEVTTNVGRSSHHYLRADLEAAYGPRPVDLDRSPEEVGRNVAQVVVPLLAGGVVVAGAVVALIAFGVSRRRHGIRA